MKIFDRLRDHRQQFQDAEQRYNEVNQRLSNMKSSGMQSQTAEQILSKLQKDVKEISEKKDSLENMIMERTSHLDKLQSWESNDRGSTEEDVRAKREQVKDSEEQLSTMTERLDGALERNNKLTVFRQASSMALKKMREREDELEKLSEEKRKLTRVVEDKEQSLSATQKGKIGKRDLKKYGAVVRDKIEKYKKMREELSTVRAELVTLQRTEQLLKGRLKNLDDFLTDLERKKGIEGYRSTQRAMAEMAEKSAEVDALKGATLEQISAMVEKINREFKSKQKDLQPLMTELKGIRQEFMDLESEYNDKKGQYEKVSVGLEMEKQALERECELYQEDCLREESRFHYLHGLAGIARIRLERCDQEKKWQGGDGRMMRDFGCYRDLYTHKLNQQDQLTKQLRKKQKELKETSEVLSGQKAAFLNLQRLLTAKIKSDAASPDPRFADTINLTATLDSYAEDKY